MKQILAIILLTTLFACGQNERKMKSSNIKKQIGMEKDKEYVRMAIEVAKDSRKKGNLPFGCVLVNKDGEVILKGENTINTDVDCLAHAEINLIRDACKKYDYSYLNDCSIYTSDEPCPMCTSAIYWSGIGKLVYGLSKAEYYRIVGRDNENWVFEMPTRELFNKGGRKVEVIGPLLEAEAKILHLE
ncbi:nucleoside deaminase [Muriicola sp. Z0-33]|uniref:nucleoside deaminase n=1 Tax=Muriicola sp. Z0-33 TaxID=2816957 RepID=UPI002238421A|nr:nucleoside deaminase [Muriicola sp. Z0-33]MCW5516948.1 nucleoside deaminase [Muriicola sp. Z0-33]